MTRAAAEPVDREVATHKRGGQAARARRRHRRTIERAAQDRHEAWSQTGVPVGATVSRLTHELDELYDHKRRQELATTRSQEDA